LSKVSVITVNYNQPQITAELLASLARVDYPDLEVIVVDNGSAEDPTCVLQQRFPAVHVIRSEENLGFAGGNNLGIQASTGDYLFFLNNDTELQNGVIECLLGLFEKVPKLGIVSPMICYFYPKVEADKELIQYAGSTAVHTLTGRNRTIGLDKYDRGQYQHPQPTAYIHGAAMLIPRKIIKEVGMMAELFFLYYEELDWCAQIKRAGYQAFVHPGVKVYHKESVTVGKLSPLKTHYLNRNRILFMRRNKSTGAFVLFSIYLLLIVTPRYLLRYAWQGEWGHFQAFWKAIWWNYGWGQKEIRSF